MRKNEDKLIHKIGRGVVTGVMTTSLVLTGTPALLAATQTVAVADEATTRVAKPDELTKAIQNTGSGTVQLTADITANVVIPTNSTITLDLNGHTLTNASATHTITVTKGGTLTLTGDGTVDNTENGFAAVLNNGTATLLKVNITRSKEAGEDPNNSGGNSYYYVENHGELMTIDGATINSNGSYSSLIHNGYYDYSKQYKQTDNAAAPKLVIDNGTFTGGINTIKNDDGGVLEVKGGSASNSTQCPIFNVNVATVSGGTFETKTEKQAAVYNWYAGGNGLDDAKLTITGGKFISPLAGIALDDANSKSSVSITGGDFTESPSLMGHVKNTPEGAIKAVTKVSGGTFADDVTDLTGSDTAVAEIKQGAAPRYAVGRQAINDAIADADESTVVTVTKGTGDLSIQPSKANVINNSDAKVTVGDVTLEKGQALWGGALSAAKIDPIDDQQHTGEELKPEPKVVVDGKTLEKGTDYDLEYKDNKDLGTATITITGKGNYAGGQAQVTFDITEKDKLAELGKAIQDSRTVDSQIDKRKFSGDSVKAFEDAIAAAEKVQSDKFSPAKDIDDAQAALTDAYDKLTPAQGIGMYRLYNPNSGEHFYTGSKAEHDHLVDVGWSDEGTGWVAPASSNTPVYRLYNPNAGDHHYTTSASERDTLIDAGWNYEGIGWFSDDDQEVPLYRQYNPNAVAGAHNFTTSREENDHLVSVGWRAEGIGWYGINASAAK